MRVAHTLFLLLLTTCFVLPTVHGQPPGKRMKMATLRTSGTIKGVRPGLLYVEVESGEEWLVSVPSNPEQVVYEATAASQWLQPGMPVRFNATVVMEKRKREIIIKEPVPELTVAPVRRDVGMGLFPEQNNDLRENLFTRRTRDAKKKRSRNEPVGVLCLIIGRLVENKKGKLRVAAGSISVRLELAPEAEISVQWHDLQWVRLGDKVDLTANYPPGRKGQAQGQQITITAAKVLDIEKKAGKGRRKSAREGKSDDSGKGKKKN